MAVYNHYKRINHNLNTSSGRAGEVGSVSGETKIINSRGECSLEFVI